MTVLHNFLNIINGWSVKPERPLVVIDCQQKFALQSIDIQTDEAKCSWNLCLLFQNTFFFFQNLILALKMLV